MTTWRMTPTNPNSSVLRFSPYAWAKLLFLRDIGQTEVAGFGIAPADNLLMATDMQLVKQRSTWASAKFDDAAVADFFDVQVDQGRKPAQFARLFLHTHPGDSPQPSGTDEETFARCFGGSDWSVMFILAQGGQTYARLQFNVGPGGSVLIPVDVDYSLPFPESQFDDWLKEYQQTVNVAEQLASATAATENVSAEAAVPLFDRDRRRFHEMSYDEWDLWEDQRGGFADEPTDWELPTPEDWWLGLAIEEQLDRLEWMANETREQLVACASRNRNQDSIRPTEFALAASDSKGASI